jgi:hypothetical protein
MKENKTFSYFACKCAPPGCPELEIFENIDGEYRVTIVDDFGGCINISLSEMAMLASKYLDVWNTGELE